MSYQTKAYRIKGQNFNYQPSITVHGNGVSIEKFHPFIVTQNYKNNQNKTPDNSQAKLPRLTKLSVRVEEENVHPKKINDSQYVLFDRFFEDFIKGVTETSVYEAIERCFKENLNCSQGICWVNIPSLDVFFSPRKSIFIKNSTGLFSEVYSKKTIIITNNPEKHPSYDATTDSLYSMSGTPSMIFPILDNQNALYAIITLSRDFGSEPFNQNDQNFVTFFQHKFQIMSRYFLNQNIQEPILLDLLQLRTTQDQLPSFLKRISNLFDCKTCEVWTYDKGKKKINKYTEKQEDIQIGEGGIVEKVLESETIINIMNTKENPSYNSLHDGENGDPLIAIPVYREKHIFYAIVLRRPKNRPFFTRDDEETLKKMAPFIALSVHDSFQFSKIQLDFEKRTAEKEGLSALLEVAEIISGQLDAERLSEIIMEKGRYLTKADRCSLFLVSPKRDHLITSFHRGLKNCIDIPITKGIVGRTVTEGKALNISNAYEDESFDKETDLKNGYHTKSILSVPIFNQRGEVIGVTEMINKLDGNDFTTWDMNIIQIFNVFCGISLENARLYKDSVEMSNQLRLFFGISNAISKNEDIQKALTDILVHTRKALDSRRASIFLIDHENKLFQTYVIDGGKVPPTIPLSSGIIGVCAETKNSLFVNDPYNDKRFNREIDGQTGFKTTSLCVAPITCAKGEILGVVELVNKIHGSFKEKDMLFLQTIASFISVLIKNMKEINN